MARRRFQGLAGAGVLELATKADQVVAQILDGNASTQRPFRLMHRRFLLGGFLEESVDDVGDVEVLERGFDAAVLLEFEKVEIRLDDLGSELVSGALWMFSSRVPRSVTTTSSSAVTMRSRSACTAGFDSTEKLQQSRRAFRGGLGSMGLRSGAEDRRAEVEQLGFVAAQEVVGEGDFAKGVLQESQGETRRAPLRVVPKRAWPVRPAGLVRAPTARGTLSVSTEPHPGSVQARSWR